MTLTPGNSPGVGSEEDEETDEEDDEEAMGSHLG